MKSESKSPMLVTTIALATILGGGLCFWGYQSLQAQAQKVHKLQAEVADAKDANKDLADAQSNLADCSQKLQHLELSVTQASYVPTLLTDLEKCGKANGIEVTGVRPIEDPASRTKSKDSMEKKPYDEQNIEVKGRGTYADVQKFVAAMQTFPKIVAVRMLDLAPKTGPGETGDTLDVTIDLRAYIFAPPPGTAPANGAPQATAMSSGVTNHAG